MNILNKLLTALRGVASETGEALIDSQAVRIMEQEIREAKENLDYAKESLTEVIAEQMGVQREVTRLQQRIAEHEGYALQALEKDDEALALDVAEKIATFSNELDAQEAVLESYSANITTLKQTIQATERNIKSMDRELAIVKTTESVQKANDAVAEKFSGSSSALRSATDSLQRIKEKQQKRNDQMTAALELRRDEDGEDLHEKLQKAGIVTSKASAGSVLERLKAKRLESGSE